MDRVRPADLTSHSRARISAVGGRNGEEKRRSRRRAGGGRRLCAATGQASPLRVEGKAEGAGV